MSLNTNRDDPPPGEIFKMYDIRGVAGESLTRSGMYQIGLAFGSEYRSTIVGEVFIACDARLSSPVLKEELIRGVRSAGCDVVDLGIIPTPLVYFAAWNSPSGTGLMVTASHNPAEYNGVKIVLARESFHGESIQRLYQRINSANLTATAFGQLSSRSVVEAYHRSVVQNIQLKRPLKVVLDCANGIAGAIAPQILRDLGCEVIELYCDVDGTFPNHPGDPTRVENLQDLIAAVTDTRSDVGLAIDGDGDRLVAVSQDGEIIWPDRLMILFARDIVAQNPGRPVVFDVKCMRALADEITFAGGEPVMWKTGHSFIREKIAHCDAVFGGELSGHLYFRDRWPGFDDGIYASARLCELLGASSLSAREVFQTLPESVATPEIRIACNAPHALVDRFKQCVAFEGAEVCDLDGIRATFQGGFGLLRASNTADEVVLRFDADSKVILRQIQDRFYQVLDDLLNTQPEAGESTSNQSSTSTRPIDR